MKKITILSLLAFAVLFTGPIVVNAQSCTSDGSPCGIGGTCRVDPEGTFYCDTTNAIQNPITNQVTQGATGNTSGSTGNFDMRWIIFYRDTIVWFVNSILVPVLIAIAFIVFLYGVFKYFIYGADNDTERATGRKFVLWGIIGFVVITSVWGLVNIVKDTLVPSTAGSTHPDYPKL